MASDNKKSGASPGQGAGRPGGAKQPASGAPGAAGKVDKGLMSGSKNPGPAKGGSAPRKG